MSESRFGSFSCRVGQAIQINVVTQAVEKFGVRKNRVTKMKCVWEHSK